MKIFALFILLILVFSLTPLVYSEEQIDELLSKGRELLKNAEPKEALVIFDKMLEIEPNNVNALNNKGAAFLMLDEYEIAINYFDRVISIDPLHINSRLNKGNAFILMGRPLEAIQSYDDVLSIEPNNIAASKGLYGTKSFFRYTPSDASMELILHDSDGNLVLRYITPNVFYLNEEQVKVYLNGKSEIIEKEGNSFISSLTLNKQIVDDSSSFLGQFGFGYANSKVFILYGYAPVVLTQPGDTLKVIFTKENFW